MDSFVELFCLIADFCQELEPHWKRHWLTQGQKKRWRQSALSLSEWADADRAVSPVVSSPIQALLSGLCLPALAR